MKNCNVLAGVSLLTLFVASPALAQVATIAPPDPTDPVAIDDVVVFGRGQTRQQTSITQAAIAIEAPGTSPLKAIERLPGVSFQSADAFGNYEWSARIVLRSFNQNQLGFTLDGVPMR